MTGRVSCLRPAALLVPVLVILAAVGSQGDDGRWVGTWAAPPN